MIFEATEVTVAYDKSTIQASGYVTQVTATVVVNTYEFRKAEDPSNLIKWKMGQICVAFSEYQNFKKLIRPIRVGLAPVSVILTSFAAYHQICLSGIFCSK